MRTRSNYIQYSETLSHSPWVLTAGAFQSTAIPSPVSGASVWNFVADTSTGTHHLDQLQNVAPTAFDLMPPGAPTTLSLYLAPAGITKVNIVTPMYASWTGTGGQLHSLTFDLTTGAISAVLPGMNVQVTPVGNGFFRIAMTAVSAGPLLSTVLTLYPLVPSTGDITGAGDNVQGFLISGVQLESGLSASAYIPNAGMSPATVIDYDSLTIAPAQVYQRTLLLDNLNWDLVVELTGNIAVADAPYSYAQDVASAIKLFAGELWYDTSQGVPYFSEVLGQAPPLALIQRRIEEAALSVTGVVSAICTLASDGRAVTGQVIFIDVNGEQAAVSL